MSGESNTYGYNTKKERFEHIESDNNHALKVFQVNSTGGGTTFDGVIKGLTDIDNNTSIKNIKVDSSGAMKVDDIQSSHLRKTFTEGIDPSIDLANDATITTGFTIMGGCDNVNSNFDQVNPIRVDTDGKLNIIATTGDISDLRNVSNGKSVATLSNEINDKITSGNSTISAGGSLQSVLIYGRKANGDLEPLECNGDRLLVDVVELAQSGKISTSTSLSSVQICGIREDTGNSFHTLKVKSDGTLINEGKCMGNSGGSQTQILVDTAGNINTMPRQPNKANIQIGASVISTWNNDISCDLIAMENYSCATIHIVFSNSSLTEDDCFIVEGTDDDSNFYPLCILRPRNGFLRTGVNTSDFIKESIYIPYAKFRITNKSGSNQPLLNNDGAFVSIHDNSSDNFHKDNEGALLIAGNIVRGVVSLPSPFGSGIVSSNPIDMGHHKTLNFHLEGMSNTHTGIIVQGSNDNSTYVKVQLFSPSDVGADSAVRASLTSAYRYYKFENGGVQYTPGSSNTFNHYD